MQDKENEIIYPIPANYTDSGKIFGGMVSPRNLVEAILLVLIFGFIEFKLIPMGETVRIIVMAITLLPLFMVALIGIDGDSLLQRMRHIVRFILNKRKLKRKEGKLS